MSTMAEGSSSVGARRRLTILYMTATGTAQDVALRVARQARRRRMQVQVHDVAAYDIADLMEEDLVLFIVATAGQGEFPPSSVEFWHTLLLKSLPADILQNLDFAAFGLGDSTYPRFCWPVRLLSRRLEALGAKQVLDHGEADDSHYLGMEASLRPWLDELWSHLPLPSGLKPIGDNELLPPTTLIRTSKDEDSAESLQHAAYLEQRGWSSSKLLENKRMTEETHFQDVRLLQFTRPDHSSYEPGDVLCLHPQNDPASVDEMLARLNLSVSARITLSGEDVPPTIPQSPTSMTLRDLFTYYLDFTAVPRQSFFEQIRLFSGEIGSLEREKLDEYCGIYPPEALASGDVNPQEGIDEMFEYAQRPRRTIKEVLDEFKSVTIPLAYLADVFPWIRPREFSIASSPSSLPTLSETGGADHIQLAVAIVKYKTRLRKPRTGLCTRWLATLTSGQQLPVLLKKGYLTLPPPSAPLILIGPGTGCAPLRSLLLDRLAANAEQQIHLFLGFRNRDKDYLFGSDWEALAKAYPSVHLHTAFSRQDNAAKIYVQDLILEQASVLWHAIFTQNAYIVVAGASGKMPEQVRAAFESIAVQQANMDADQAKRFIDTLERQKRWQEECWS